MRRLLRLLSPVHRRRQARILAEIRHRTPAPTRRPGPRRVGRRMPNGSAYYRTTTRQPIDPDQVRDRRFPDRVRRGCEPGEVRAFLNLVADELAALQAELVSTRDENLRIKRALRDWQSQFRSPEVPA